jgi:hypothetical protein
LDAAAPSEDSPASPPHFPTAGEAGAAWWHPAAAAKTSASLAAEVDEARMNFVERRGRQ